MAHRQQLLCPPFGQGRSHRVQRVAAKAGRDLGNGSAGHHGCSWSRVLPEAAAKPLDRAGEAGAELTRVGDNARFELRAPRELAIGEEREAFLAEGHVLYGLGCGGSSDGGGVEDGGGGG